ncbi:MAG: RecQ family ATP-dependent DNA helicase [Anaeroplasmataceae bacterium]
MNKYEILKKYYGYNDFRGRQESIIDSILERKNTLAIIPTGGGKSICFQIPALIFDGITLVITPLISLMSDQVRELKNYNIWAEYINSSSNSYDIYKNINNIKLLYISPERLINKDFLNAIKRVKISLIVIDEAHTLMWHMDFRESFLNIKGFINDLGYKVVISCFTATANKYTIEEIKRVTGIYNYNLISDCFDRKELFYKIVYNKNKLDFIIDYLNNHHESGIIYAQTRNDVMMLYNRLLSYDVIYYHGALDNNIKEENQSLFITNKKRIMISTVAFGMGINKPDIRFVINYNIPDSIESLAQMSGRCSRDKSYGECIILYNESDTRVLKYFISNIDSNLKNNKEIKRIKDYKYYQLNSILYLCKNNICIHKYMSYYFGIKIDNCKNMCNRCLRS